MKDNSMRICGCGCVREAIISCVSPDPDADKKCLYYHYAAAVAKSRVFDAMVVAAYAADNFGGTYDVDSAGAGINYVNSIHEAIDKELKDPEFVMRVAKMSANLMREPKLGELLFDMLLSQTDHVGGDDDSSKLH